MQVKSFIVIVYLAFFSSIHSQAGENEKSSESNPATEVPMTVSVDYDAATRPLDKGRVLNGSQGGYEAMADLNWFPKALPKLKQIGFQMIRLDHLFSDKFYKVVSRDKEGRIACDFSRLDRVILKICEAGMKPLMCLSYCPDILLEPGKDDASHPTNLGDWKEIVGQMVAHYAQHGQTGLYWEVWNEPDAKYFYAGTQKHYLELYLASADAVKKADPTARIGGAADANFLSGTSQIVPLLDYVKANPKTPFDFMSYHWYGGCTRDGKPPYDLEWESDKAVALFRSRGLQTPEIFIDEWNTSYVMDAGAGADSDTNRTAPGLAARIFNAFEHPEITKIFYFAPLEGYRPKRLMNGDLGLLTVDYHKKAAYNVFDMVHRLGDNRLKTMVVGPKLPGHPTHAMATSNKAGDEITVLLWNYSDTPFLVDLSIDHLPWKDQEKIKLTKYLIDADHANYFNYYQSKDPTKGNDTHEDLTPTECRAVAPSEILKSQHKLSPFSVVELVFRKSSAKD